MIANYIIKPVNLFEGYKRDIELNLTVQQFLNGLEIIAEHAAS
jgi:site-specific DNA recombinase